MTQGYEPLLIVAYIGNRPVGKLLAVIRKSMRLSPRNHQTMRDLWHRRVF